ncbi:hypothetical protein [Kineococcus aurantiacus]|uniref:hypothetical protein n=1 Tax=Kineococcus aurantiacus TaxID=37633 RepID=UPI0031E11C00
MTLTPRSTTRLPVGEVEALRAGMLVLQYQTFVNRTAKQPVGLVVGLLVAGLLGALAVDVAGAGGAEVGLASAVGLALALSSAATAGAVEAVGVTGRPVVAVRTRWGTGWWTAARAVEELSVAAASAALRQARVTTLR